MGAGTKGRKLAFVISLLFLFASVASANPPLPQIAQEEEYCNVLKVAGTGVVEISTSVVDRRIALEYYNVMYGEGDFEMDHSNRVSTSADQMGVVAGKTSPFNLIETTKMAFSGKTPLVGMKSIKSRAFWGGIGAEVQESFSVTEMEKEETTFFASTAPLTGQQSNDPRNGLNPMTAPYVSSSPVHMVGMEVTNSFNGTWENDASWHKIFYKNIKVHEAFSGQFEVKKLLQFHENPRSEPRVTPCDGIDC